MKRTTLYKIRELIAQRVDCKTGGSCYAKWIDGERSTHDRYYVVYSYGEHFPMYLWSDGQQRWFGNSDKYSVTTTKHQSYARPPYDEPITWLDTTALREMIRTRPSHRKRLVRNRLAA